MKKLILIMSGLVFLSGCSSLDIKPITPEQAKNAHGKENSIEGYIIHAPKVYVSVVNLENECKISNFLMPDKKRPFSIDIKEGIGKINATINITNGWMLGNVSANIDNTSVLGDINDILTTKVKKSTALELITLLKNKEITDEARKILEDLIKEIKKLVAELQKPICGIENGIYSLENMSANTLELKRVN